MPVNEASKVLSILELELHTKLDFVVLRRGRRVKIGVFQRQAGVVPAQDKNWYATDAFTDMALDYLDRYAGDEQPFFLYIAHTAPHHPLQAPEDEIARYRGKYLMGWDLLRQRRWKRLQELGIAGDNWKLSARDAEAPSWGSVNNKDESDLAMAVYAAMVDRMDQNIGRVLQKIQELGAEENTLVLFLSDNGACAEINNQTPDISHSAHLEWVVLHFPELLAIGIARSVNFNAEAQRTLRTAEDI